MQKKTVILLVLLWVLVIGGIGVSTVGLLANGNSGRHWVSDSEYAMLDLCAPGNGSPDA